MTTTTALELGRQKRAPMTDGLTRRGPKRRAEIDPDKMVTTTCRLPAGLLWQIEAEVARVARETGLSSVNRSDLMRALLLEALAARAAVAHVHREVR
jgi:hypothetical protein